MIKLPSIPFLYLLNPAGAYPSCHWARGKWAGRQSIRDKCDKQPPTLTREDLESPINLTCMVLAVGRKLENSWELNLELSYCEATVLTTTKLDTIIFTSSYGKIWVMYHQLWKTPCRAINDVTQLFSVTVLCNSAH